MLTGGYDSRVNVADVRDVKNSLKTKIPKSAKDIESLAWHPTLEHNFCVSTESGQVFGFDSRKITDPVFVT